MNCVSSFLRNHVIGEGRAYKNQVALARKAGLTPSTMNGVLKSGQVGAATILKIGKALSARQRDELCAAAVRDALPPQFAGLVFKGGKVAVRDEAAVSLLSPLAKKTLDHLRDEAVRDPMTQKWLERQGEWMGLDKV